MSPFEGSSCLRGSQRPSSHCWAQHLTLRVALARRCTTGFLAFALHSSHTNLELQTSCKHTWVSLKIVLSKEPKANQAPEPPNCFFPMSKTLGTVPKSIRWRALAVLGGQHFLHTFGDPFLFRVFFLGLSRETEGNSAILGSPLSRTNCAEVRSQRISEPLRLRGSGAQRLRGTGHGPWAGVGRGAVRWVPTCQVAADRSAGLRVEQGINP